MSVSVIAIYVEASFATLSMIVIKLYIDISLG